MNTDDKSRGRGKSAGNRRPRPHAIKVRQVAGQDTFELVHPKCAQDLQQDVEEVHAMLKAGELEIAVDELRWLLENCREFLEAHRLLGELALADNCIELARAHLGYAWELGLKATGKAFSGRLPYKLPANRPLLQSGKGLLQCLLRQGETKLAQEVTRLMLAFDPTDPLQVRGLERGRDD
jgi:hypothetical protein